MPAQLPYNLYIVIPAYNEHNSIGDVLANLLPYGARLIVVDDGSVPSMPVPEHPAITILRHRANLGQGAALQTGITYALREGAGFIVSFDADGQHDPADLALLLQPILEGSADVALASRFLKPGSHNAPPFKTLVLKLGRWVNYVFTGLYLTDAHNGFRAMNRVAALTIRISENRMAHATEILAQIRRHRLRFVEVPCSVRYTTYSRGKGQSPWNSIRIFFDLVLQKLFR